MKAKEIWYVWSGVKYKNHKSNKPKMTTALLLSDGSVRLGADKGGYSSTDMYKGFYWESSVPRVITYTLGETRERVECDYCLDGLFYYDDVREVKCHVCNGSGHVWRMGEKNEKI